MRGERTASAVAGFQIAFLIFAFIFLNAPLDRFVLTQWQWARDLDVPLARPVLLITGGVLLFLIAPVRRICAQLLAPRIPRGKRREVVLATTFELTASMGALGGFALWHYMRGGEMALARAMGEHASDAVQMERALTTAHVVMFVFVAGMVAPIVEELVFRGLLYRPWSRAWGWLSAAIASSLVFGFFHGLVWPQFLAGLVFVVAMRRTGTLRAPIYAHALGNLLLWHPLLGQFLLPAARSTGELHVWWLHLTCLAATAIVLPWYIWSAREARLPAPPEFAEARIA